MCLSKRCGRLAITQILHKFETHELRVLAVRVPTLLGIIYQEFESV